MSSFFGGEFGDNVQATPLADFFLAPPLERGKYRDWQGDLYDVMHVVRDVHEGKWMVLYRSLIDDRQPMMVMLYAKFFGTVDVGGYRPVPRFTVVRGVGDRAASIPPPLPSTASPATAPAKPSASGHELADGSDAGGSDEATGNIDKGVGSGPAMADGDSTATGNGPALPLGNEVRAVRRAPRAPASFAYPKPQTDSTAAVLPYTPA